MQQLTTQSQALKYMWVAPWVAAQSTWMRFLLKAYKKYAPMLLLCCSIHSPFAISKHDEVNSLKDTKDRYKMHTCNVNADCEASINNYHKIVIFIVKFTVQNSLQFCIYIYVPNTYIICKCIYNFILSIIFHFKSKCYN